MAIWDMKSDYNPIESFLYDALIAPAVSDFRSELETEYFDQLKKGARVVDVGCGGGQLLRGLAEKRPDLKLTGVDLSKEQVARARKRATKRGLDIEYVEGSALDLPFEDGAFDGLVSVASIKHWPDMAAGFAECVRVVKKGGMVLVLEVDRGCRLEDARRFVEEWRIPRIMRTGALTYFRTFVAGQGLDRDNVHEIIKGQPLVKPEIRKFSGLPAIAVYARKA